jgi:transposase InsO family protein
MNYHSNAQLTQLGRERLARAVIEEGWTLKKAAAFFSVSEPTAAKWAGRYRKEGIEGLRDRSSRPYCSPRRTPSAQEAVVLSMRRLRMPGFQIARQSGLSRSTVSRILRRHGINKLSALEPKAAVVRYERKNPGELLHIDIKKLGRIEKPGHRVTGNRQNKGRKVGWEYVHVAIDDASRIAYAQILPDERHQSAEIFLRAALGYFASLAIKVERLMSDNGAAYRSKPFAALLRNKGIRHIFTKPYTPKTNGKAERFIQTSLREWAYAAVYQNSDHRSSHLQPWIHRYNWHRPHSALKLKTPIQRLNLPINNLLSLHS